MGGNHVGRGLSWTISQQQYSNSPEASRENWVRGLPLLLVALVAPVSASAVDRSQDQVITIVTQIKRADYEGDRAALERLQEGLTPFIENRELGARVRYWRGFALWRRAINGFNDNVPATELQEDLRRALSEFEEASKKDPTFADAKIAALSCVGFLMYSLHQQDPGSTRMQDLITQGRQLRKDAEALAPDNPRLAWVMGPMIWNSPPERGGGQGKAIEQYEKALARIRGREVDARSPLEPSWGEPELLMSLAWSSLNRSTPDINAAEKYARSALDLVPYWHYVRDILMPQIREARKKLI